MSESAYMTDAERAAMEAEAAYKVEIDNDGCQRCGGQRTWTIVGPDGVAIGRSFYDKEAASDLCYDMNNAHDAARAHYTSQARPPEPALFTRNPAPNAAAPSCPSPSVTVNCGPITSMWDDPLYDAAPASAPAPAASNHKRDCRILSTERLDPGQRYCDCGYEAQMPRTYVAAEAGSGAAPDVEHRRVQRRRDLVQRLRKTYPVDSGYAEQASEAADAIESDLSSLTALRARVAELEGECGKAARLWKQESIRAERAETTLVGVQRAAEILQGLLGKAESARDALAAQVERMTQERDQLRTAVLWAMGFNVPTEQKFRPRNEDAGDGAYWWRSLWRMACPIVNDSNDWWRAAQRPDAAGAQSPPEAKDDPS